VVVAPVQPSDLDHKDRGRSAPIRPTYLLTHTDSRLGPLELDRAGHPSAGAVRFPRELPEREYDPADGSREHHRGRDIPSLRSPRSRHQARWLRSRRAWGCSQCCRPLRPAPASLPVRSSTARTAGPRSPGGCWSSRPGSPDEGRSRKAEEAENRWRRDRLQEDPGRHAVVGDVSGLVSGDVQLGLPTARIDRAHHAFFESYYDVVISLYVLFKLARVG
jgi:hypothetical protein